MSLVLESYPRQLERWPQSGRHILAQFDADTVVVYQAYRPETGHYAATHGRFGDGFSLDRMSWIKPNFLWMMHRSGWGTKAGQEVVLAIRLRRAGFDAILEHAIPTSYDAEFGPRTRWEDALQMSDVLFQWDPDHDPHGAEQARRAIQLGLRSGHLRRYVNEWTVSIEDISAFVAEQRRIKESGKLDALQMPREEVYPVTSRDAARRLRITEA